MGIELPRRAKKMFWIVLAGTAKPIPTLPPEGEKIAVFMPTTLPLMSNVGPPELPLLMGASIWM